MARTANEIADALVALADAGMPNRIGNIDLMLEAAEALRTLPPPAADPVPDTQAALDLPAPAKPRKKAAAAPVAQPDPVPVADPSPPAADPVPVAPAFVPPPVQVQGVENLLAGLAPPTA